MPDSVQLCKYRDIINPLKTRRYSTTGGNNQSINRFNSCKIDTADGRKLTFQSEASTLAFTGPS